MSNTFFLVVSENEKIKIGKKIKAGFHCEKCNLAYYIVNKSDHHICSGCDNSLTINAYSFEWNMQYYKEKIKNKSFDNSLCITSTTGDLMSCYTFLTMIKLSCKINTNYYRAWF